MCEMCYKQKEEDMSTVVVVAPILIGSWSVLSAAIVAAMTSMGYSICHEANQHKQEQESTQNKAEIELEESEILGEITGVEQEIVVQNAGVTATFTRDERGSLKVCVEGKGYSKSQLKEIGEELIGRVTQQYVYHKVVSEMKEQHMTIVHEEMDEDRTVRIRVRNF